MSRFLRVSDDPASTFVAGLSMGGYGALKHAVTHPERYAGVHEWGLWDAQVQDVLDWMAAT